MSESRPLDSYSPLVPAEQPFTTIPPPKAACKLSLMRTGQMRMPGFLFVQDFEGDMLLADYSFLIEHPEHGKVVFDLGLRKNLAYGSQIKRLFEVWQCESPLSVQDYLKKADIHLESLRSVIFSHTHFDHVGDVSDLPKSVSLEFGAYTDISKVEDSNKLAEVLHVSADMLKNRKVTHLSHSKAWTTIGSLRGIDYFGDGSLFLLDTPGHYEGHIAALVCIADEPKPLYHLLAGDAAHHISLIDYDEPARIGVFPAKANKLSPFREKEPDKLQSFEVDMEASYQTMASLAKMDREEGINVILAHDSSMEVVLPKSASHTEMIPLSPELFQTIKHRSRVDILQQQKKAAL